MKPARTPKRHLGDTKLLVFSQEEQVVHSRVSEITEYLSSGDLLIVNRSGTLPSSFRGKIERSGEELEIRLASFQGPSRSQLENWFAFAFGEGDWTSPTEERGAPPELLEGDRIIIGPELFAQVLHVEKAKLLSIRWVSKSLEQALYKYGKPIQYSYLKEELNTWDQQTIFSGPPISVEPPSSAFPLSWESIFKLKDQGVEVASLLHGAGISSTGCKSLDKSLPLEEWYEIPRETVKKIHRAQREGRRIVALGTTVLRALESAWKKGEVVPGVNKTTLRISPKTDLNVITGLITGMHESGTSHREILPALCSKVDLEKGYEEALERGYLGHEYGDLSLVRCS